MDSSASTACCYGQGIGWFTSLILADALPASTDIPRLQQGHRGKMVLR